MLKAEDAKTSEVQSWPRDSLTEGLDRGVRQARSLTRWMGRAGSGNLVKGNHIYYKAVGKWRVRAMFKGGG